MTRRPVLWLHGAMAGARDMPFDTVAALLGPGADIHAPQFGEPEAEAWCGGVAEALDAAPPDTLLIGHSLGGTTLIKVLAERFPGRPAPALFAFAAPYWGRGGWDYDGFRLPGDAAEGLANIGALHFYHGAADDIVEPHHSDLYAAAFPSARCRIVPGADHLFTGCDLAAFTEDLARIPL